MFLKNLFIYLYFCFYNPYLLYLCIFFFFLYQFFVSSDIKFKLFFFFLIVILFSIWGFMFDLDGIIILFLLSELILIFYFIIVYTQVYRYNLKKKKLDGFIFDLLKILTCFALITGYGVYFKINLYSLVYYDYYLFISCIIPNDFFVLYRFFFIDYLIISFMLIFILSFFSLFFILVYFSLKAMQQQQKKKKTINFLKKQALYSQVEYKSAIRCFK